MACQDDQLCARIKTGISSAMHGVQDLWDENLTKESWEFLLVDANNAFNKINRVRMIWTVRHYGRPEIVLSLISTVTGHCLS